MNRCGKCGGLVVVHNDEVRCLNCGRYYFSPDEMRAICSQGGSCGYYAEIDGLCAMHHQQRMTMVNRNRRAGFKYRA